MHIETLAVRVEILRTQHGPIPTPCLLLVGSYQHLALAPTVDHTGLHTSVAIAAGHNSRCPLAVSAILRTFFSVGEGKI